MHVKPNWLKIWFCLLLLFTTALSGGDTTHSETLFTPVGGRVAAEAPHPRPQPFSKEPPAAIGDNFSFLCLLPAEAGRGGQAWWQEGNGSLTSLPLGGWAQQSGVKLDSITHCAPPPHQHASLWFFKPGLPPPGAPSEFAGLCLPSKQDPSIPR